MAEGGRFPASGFEAFATLSLSQTDLGLTSGPLFSAQLARLAQFYPEGDRSDS
jgi:hypothetical protein